MDLIQSSAMTRAPSRVMRSIAGAMRGPQNASGSGHAFAVSSSIKTSTIGEMRTEELAEVFVVDVVAAWF
jgi:hypothetical protein